MIKKITQKFIDFFYKNRSKEVSLFFIGLVLFFAYFPSRYIFNFESVKSIEGFRENITLSFYVFDFFIIVLILNKIFQKVKDFSSSKKTLLKINHEAQLLSLKNLQEKIKRTFLTDPFFYFAIFLTLELILARNENLFAVIFYNTFRFLEIITFFFVLKNELIKNKNRLYFLSWIIISVGAIQAILAILQFYLQKSVGLSALGESLINPEVLGVAKFEKEGVKILRSYGTFPHPNILGAFLFQSLVLTFWMLFYRLQNSKGFKKIFFIACGGLILLGITLSFSRSVIFATTLFIIIFFFFHRENFFKIHRHLCKKIKVPSHLCEALGIMLFFVVIFWSYNLIAPRLCFRDCPGDYSVVLRSLYNTIALKIIHLFPFFGIGLGTFSLRMGEFSKEIFLTWQLHPAHNLFFLAFAETGLIGGGLFFVGVLEKIFQFKNFFTPLKNPIGLGMMLLVFLGLFDHYFWTLPQGQLIFFSQLAFCTIFTKIKKG